MPSPLISTAELAARLGSPDTVVVDARHDLPHPEAGRRAYAAGHIPGASFLHQDRDLAGERTGRNGRHPLPDPDALAARLCAIGVGERMLLVAYDDQSGMFAARLWWLLRWLGHEAVAVLDGGLRAWRDEGRPVTTAPPTHAPARFTPRIAMPTANAAEILDALGDGSLRVVDARSPERFRGEAEPIDPVAGRIPGAVNRPASMNVGADGRFKPPHRLREEFMALLGEVDPGAVVHQCGSGVTACHNLLAMEVAGLSGSRLYPGSWSEWCSDPGRPVARGAG